MKVRVHAVNKQEERGMQSGHAQPHAVSRVFDSETDSILIENKIKEFNQLSKEMLIEVVPVDEDPSWLLAKA